MNSRIAFAEADTNQDGVLSQDEFRNLVARNSLAGNANMAGGYRSSAYESAATRSSSFGLRSSTGDFSASSNTQQYATDAQGNFKDENPQVVRRPAPGDPLTYTQNIRVHFLQPPPVAPHGPLIIKEVRPPQPPPPTPLVVRQRAPELPQPPPLVLRERPPPAPATVASQTVVRNLAAVAVPPRSVVIEKIPPAPPKPRDIIIERWIPYAEMSQRKTVVQRAEAVKAYPQPRNVVIQYEAPQVRVIRQFQRLGVTPENPQEYLQRYGASLLDIQTLIQQARAAGIVEDISPPSASGPASPAAPSPTGGSDYELNDGFVSPVEFRNSGF